MRPSAPVRNPALGVWTDKSYGEYESQ